MKIFVDDIRLMPEEYDLLFKDNHSFLKWIDENPDVIIEKLSLDHDIDGDDYDGTKMC